MVQVLYRDDQQVLTGFAGDAMLPAVLNYLRLSASVDQWIPGMIQSAERVIGKSSQVRLRTALRVGADIGGRAHGMAFWQSESLCVLTMWSASSRRPFGIEHTASPSGPSM